ncbi:transcriptional regulator, TetR family [Butyrivibrio hungatei]|uniref:Transcriptional regulator, TetR family n=1 Tax=Butyrivibrio hungatei TaxID=185008 RepID=A0A1G5FVY5_9FIRM|nr:TetR/AcrR family transcriptional regulator [Butyrivibrio hungatei]SCY43297.1 transcriptional regulator, TetR family [Butyrivibrio hungatei]
MRVVKEAIERRNEILDAAEELFVTKGYDKTSTNDILDRVGIARGTLYYHFKSKEDILNAMIERINDSLIAKAKMIAADTSVPVIDRLVMTIASLNVETDIGHEIIGEVHKPQNALMHQKMQENLTSGIVSVLLELAEEGVRQGLFNIKYPAETIEMLVLYSNIAFDDYHEKNSPSMEKKIAAFLYNTEKLLGAREGSLQKVLRKLFQ